MLSPRWRQSGQKRSIAPFAIVQWHRYERSNNFFLNGRNEIKDAEIIPLVEQTLDASNPREWYYALMDYGVMLKKTHPNPSRRSAHYHRQSPFKSSNRRIRGMILKSLITQPNLSARELAHMLKLDLEQVKTNLAQLHADVIHFAKAKQKFKGIYQYMYNNFAAILPAQYHYLNFEQDLDELPLRIAKSSYVPDMMLKKYRLRPK